MVPENKEKGNVHKRVMGIMSKRQRSQLEGVPTGEVWNN